jgi:hypothetical protein
MEKSYQADCDYDGDGRNAPSERAAYNAVHANSKAAALAWSVLGVFNTALESPTGEALITVALTLGTGGGGRSKNKLQPDPSAVGDHTTFARDPSSGRVTKYQTWHQNSRNPVGFDPGLRYDGNPLGAPHYNKQTGERIETPHVSGPDVPGGVRRPYPNEMPR